MTSTVVLRNDVVVDDPLGVVLGFLAAWRLDTAADGSRANAFDESDLRRANGDGARISAAEIAAVLERRRAIERALRAIPPDASLADAVAWPSLGRLFDGFGGIRGLGLSKATKTLHRKRPALVPMLDSVVQKYLEADDPGAAEPFGERAVALVRGYKHDVDRNRVALRTVRRRTGLTEVRILDLLIWADRVGPPGAR